MEGYFKITDEIYIPDEIKNNLEEKYTMEGFEYFIQTYQRLIELKSSHPKFETEIPCIPKYSRNIQVFGCSMKLYQTCRLKLYCKVNDGSFEWFYINNPKLAEEIIKIFTQLKNKSMGTVIINRSVFVFSILEPILVLDTEERSSKFIMDTKVHDMDINSILEKMEKELSMISLKKNFEKSIDDRLDKYFERNKKKHLKRYQEMNAFKLLGDEISLDSDLDC